MPQLGNADIKQFYLPSTAQLPQEEQAWVKLDVGDLLAGEMIDFATATGEDGTMKMDFTIQILEKRIVEWNFTKADGTVEEVTIGNVRRMSANDLKYLMEQFQSKLSLSSPLGDEQKKS